MDETDENEAIYKNQKEKYYEEVGRASLSGLDISKIESPKRLRDNDKVFYALNRDGRVYLEKLRNRLLEFWLPYGITTVIAIASLIARFRNI